MEEGGSARSQEGSDEGGNYRRRAITENSKRRHSSTTSGTNSNPGSVSAVNLDLVANLTRELSEPEVQMAAEKGAREATILEERKKSQRVSQKPRRFID